MTEKILPIPCTKVEGETVKDWFEKINEEMDELKTEITSHIGLDDEIEILEIRLDITALPRC